MPLEFHAAHLFSNRDEHLKVVNTMFQNTLEVFQANVKRVRDLGMLPYKLAGIATLMENRRVVACHKLNIDPGFLGENTEQEWDVEQEADRLLDDYGALEKDHRDSLMARCGIRVVDAFLSGNRKDVEDAVKANFVAMVSGMQTAYEIVAKGLWDEIEDWKHLLPATKTKADYAFHTPFKLREAYKAIFPKDRAIVEKAVNSDTDTLQILRNVFAHSAGKVDASFQIQCQKSLAKRPAGSFHILAWAKLNIGHEISLTGSLVSGVIEPSLLSCCELVKAVDDWVTANP